MSRSNRITESLRGERFPPGQVLSDAPKWVLWLENMRWIWGNLSGTSVSPRITWNDLVINDLSEVLLNCLAEAFLSAVCITLMRLLLLCPLIVPKLIFACFISLTRRPVSQFRSPWAVLNISWCLLNPCWVKKWLYRLTACPLGPEIFSSSWSAQPHVSFQKEPSINCGSRQAAKRTRVALDRRKGMKEAVSEYPQSLHWISTASPAAILGK